MDIATFQPIPFFKDGPDPLSQRDNGVRGRKNPSLSRFRNAIPQASFRPMLCIDILFSHQSANVEDHFDPKLSLQSKRNRRRYVRARVYQFDLVSSHEAACITDPS